MTLFPKGGPAQRVPGDNTEDPHASTAEHNERLPREERHGADESSLADRPSVCNPRLMLISLATILALGSTASDVPSPKRAEADLAAGKPVFVRSSGIVGPGPLSPRYDPEFGLPVEDTGCIAVGDDEYNGIVRKWIATNGLPKNSMKPRFVTFEVAAEAIRKGKRVKSGKPTILDGGWTVTIDEQVLRVTAKGAAKPAIELWSAPLSAVVAISGTSAFVQSSAGPAPVILHLDLETSAFLQKLLPKQK